MSHWHGGKIDIEDGVVTYTPRPDNDLLATVPAEGETEEGKITRCCFPLFTIHAT